MGVLTQIALILLVSCVNAGLSYERYQLIDYMSHGDHANYLFRCNEPIVNNTFQYDEIMNYTATRLQEHNLTLSENTYVVDVNLLEDVFDEHGQIEIEKKFFENNPTLGRVDRHSIVGNLINPSLFPEWMLKLALKVYEHFNWDELPKFVPRLRHHLLTQNDKSHVYFIHCESGSDRTGEVAAAYEMMYMNYTGPQANKQNIGIAGRYLRIMSVNGMRWWCWWLTYEKGYTDLDCEGIKGSTPEIIN